MKSIIQAFILLVIFIDPAFSQDDFKVIKVNGTILLTARGISLETGTVFSGNEDLLFRSEDATAAVINSKKGRLILTNQNHDLSSASPNYLPPMYNMSERGGPSINFNDLSTTFSGKYVVLENQKVKVDGEIYPMDNEHFFFLRYVYKGEEINKKLGFSGDTLIIEKASLLTIDGNPIPSADNTSIKLLYHKGKESVHISDFDLIFPDMMQLKKEIEIILSEIKGKPSGEKIDEIDSFINDFYGKIQRENLTGWLKTNFAIY
jgi:hypothetical protein